MAKRLGVSYDKTNWGQSCTNLKTAIKREFSQLKKADEDSARRIEDSIRLGRAGQDHIWNSRHDRNWEFNYQALESKSNQLEKETEHPSVGRDFWTYFKSLEKLNTKIHKDQLPEHFRTLVLLVVQTVGTVNTVGEK